MKFHHIGFLTKNLKKSQKDFSLLKYKSTGKIINDKKFKVKILFIKKGNNTIELVNPYKVNFGLNKMIKKENYSYHFAYITKSFEKDIKKFKRKFKLIVNPTPAVAFKGKKVCFFKMKNSFIIELIQS